MNENTYGFKILLLIFLFFYFDIQVYSAMNSASEYNPSALTSHQMNGIQYGGGNIILEGDASYKTLLKKNLLRFY